jgi:hypothetical protein
MSQKNKENLPLDYYKRRSIYLKRRYGRKLSGDSWVGGEIDTGDNVVLEEHELMTSPGEFTVLYALYHRGRLIAMYDDALVAEEVARVVHEILRLERLQRRRR